LATQLLDQTGQEIPAKLRLHDFRHLILFLSGFVVLSLALCLIQRSFPSIKDGARIIADAKLSDERNNLIFPARGNATRVIVFGNSVLLAGFQARHFDEMGRTDGLELASYNAGLPARGDFVSELKTIVATGNPPDVVLLTDSWQPEPRHRIFSLPLSDHDLADMVFPFHEGVRDFINFAARARNQGGLRAFYRQSQQDEAQMRRDQGYFFIREQSRYPDDRLPDSDHSPTDKPDIVRSRSADWESHQLDELNEVLRLHPMTCLFVPFPGRRAAAAPAPYDQKFARQLAAHTPCKVIGPYYFSYGNSYFSDYMHVNREGAQVYTKDLFHLVKPYLHRGNNALQ